MTKAYGHMYFLKLHIYDRSFHYEAFKNGNMNGKSNEILELRFQPCRLDYGVEKVEEKNKKAKICSIGIRPGMVKDDTGKREWFCE
ncbi:UNVERIFIED_CONTAM: hypothetical protein NCL1_15043 [Trichonephila clavipes]